MLENSISIERFYVGGRYQSVDAVEIMHGQMYCEVLTPRNIAHRYPLVLIHGNGQTGTNWLNTPDGRQGWAHFFAAAGWKVCVVDQPARGRSAWQPGLQKTLRPLPVGMVERLFTAPEAFNLWPQARLHTQWPGGNRKGRAGDPIFDQFYASQVPSLDRAASDEMMQFAGPALLDKIGPSILVVHSQSGVFAWLMAEARPDLVKGIVAVEPTGPPFRDVRPRGEPDRQWGLANVPLTYWPAVTSELPLKFVQQSVPDGPDLAACWAQCGAPRRLVHLAMTPVLVVTGEASYHAAYDHCTVRYLKSAGVSAEHCRLENMGIKGNGHMMMLESNSLEIASLIGIWLQTLDNKRSRSPTATAPADSHEN